MSPSATGARRTDNGKASQEPRRSSKYDKEAPYKSDSAGERSRRESISSDGEAQDVLLDAAWDGDVDAVARALRNAPVNGCDLHGQTPLHLAAERDKLAVAMLLLDRGADVHARSDGGRTPLHLAARSASSSTVETLLERGGSDPNARTAKGRTALHYAASAARDGDEERREVLRILRDWGADPTVEDRDGETARDVAQKRSHWDAASTLKRAERRWDEEHKQNWLQRHGFMR
jgi:ankyrin repeat protein